MQMYRSKASKLDRVAKGTGLGVLAGLTLFAVSQTACQPGSLDCDDPPACSDWQGGAGGAGGGGGNGEGGSGGGGPIMRMDAGAGGSGGGSGGTGGGGGGVVSASTALTGCAKFPTVGKLEQDLFVPKCATAGCHDASTFGAELKSADAFKRLLDKPATYPGMCKDEKYVDSANPTASYFLSKMKDAMPKCNGKGGGARMPFTKPALPEDEIACVEAYVKAISGK